MDNLEIYNNLRTPPADALRTISFGALKGKSDISPQWRTEVMTQQFGACGIGWRFEIVDRYMAPVPTTNELMVYVLIHLYIKDGDAWSAAIPAWGGDFVIKKDKNGLHGNDEALKMATTDALGKAMALIGVAADVYRGIKDGTCESKYARRDYNAAYADSQRNNIQTHRQTRNVAQTPYQETTDGNHAILKAVDVTAKKNNIVPADVAAIIAVKYAVESSRHLSREQCLDLSKNLVKYYNELKGIA